MVFASTDEYFYYWHKWVLPNVLQNKYDAKTLKTFYILCSALTNHHVYIYCNYIADWLV